jgi:two-component system NtrC family sensor kinase
MASPSSPVQAPAPAAGASPRGRGLGKRRRRQLIRLSLTYLAPVILLTVFFLLQYHWIVEESRRLHLLSIAEHQANTLDLFLRERLANVANCAADAQLPLPPSSAHLAGVLSRLKQDSDSFVDVGYFDSSGEQVAYAGPYPALEHRDYSHEQWFTLLRQRPEGYIITDIYLGFRGQPHFTIAVRRVIDDQYHVLRATLDPQQIYAYVTRLKGSSEVVTFIVNRGGGYQLAPAPSGTAPGRALAVPPVRPATGTLAAAGHGVHGLYAYSWLQTADWALIAQEPATTQGGLLGGGFARILLTSFAVTLTVFCIIWVRANKLAQSQEKTDQAEAQLAHAAKLASVGELAAGIAHEINNPLAVVTEQAGLVRDLINPELPDQITLPEVVPYLERIEAAAFRCRDITRKLLQFVRRTEVDLREHDIRQLIDEVAEGLLGHELAVSNIELVREYADGVTTAVTDKNQLQQVLVNLLNNAVDALAGPGRITISTAVQDGTLRLAVSDTGRGMSNAQLEKAFLPFFTTKAVGRGTGLGLSVSYGIVKSMGGQIEVKSAPGKGSTFTIVLPLPQRLDTRRASTVAAPAAPKS